AALPEALRTPTTPQRSYLYANDGKTLITTFYDVNRTDVPLTEIAPVMREAIVAAEDRRFYSHGGTDLRGIARALVANVTGGGTEQGGSTLTMQYVRNVLKTDPNRTAEERAAATEQTVGRKLQEIRYATALEQRLSKDEILNRYLNIAYFGSGAYGIAAASQRYFAKSPAELTLPEAALLAGLVQSPDAYSPIDGDADAALARRAYVLDAMAATSKITAEQATAAQAEKVTLRPTQQPNGCTAVADGHDDWGFFCDYLRQWWLTQPAFGETVAEREQALRRGGYTVVTSLDPKLQQTAQQQATAVYGYDDKRALPIAAVQPGTGRVLAMAVNRHYSLDANPDGQANHPNTVNPLISGGGGVDGYQAGSTFKLFTMLAALENGKQLATAVDTIVGRPVAGKTGSSEGAATETFVGFTPQVAVAGIAANPDDPGDAVGSAVQAKVIAAVARTIRAAVDGQPVRDFTPPSRELAGEVHRPAPQPTPTPSPQETLPPDVLRWLNRTRG
ncbi:transglycosylase domain-containing protein, partial [Micromonospora sp. DH15]|nr:transglycosylase domain-containing protein [Micromonospora sp. DH15]